MSSTGCAVTAGICRRSASIAEPKIRCWSAIALCMRHCCSQKFHTNTKNIPAATTGLTGNTTYGVRCDSSPIRSADSAEFLTLPRNAGTVCGVFRSLEGDVLEPCCRIEVTELRGCVQALIQSRTHAEDRIDDEIGEGAASDTAPVLDIRRVLGGFVSTACQRRDHIFSEVALPDGPLIAGLGHFSQPLCNRCRRRALIKAFGAHGRPCGIRTKAAVVRANIPRRIRIAGGEGAHPFLRLQLIVEEASHFQLLFVG